MLELRYLRNMLKYADAAMLCCWLIVAAPLLDFV